MKVYNVTELIRPSQYSFNYELKYRVDEQGNVIPYESQEGTLVTVFSSLEFYNEVRNKFGHMLYPAYYGDTLELARAEFKDIFDVWCNLNRYGFARMFQALTVDYNPVENFFRRELGSEVDEHHKGNKSKREVEELGAENLEMHKGNTTTVNDSINGYNNANAVPSDSSTSTTKDISATVFDHDKKSFENRKTVVDTTNEDISDTVFDKDVHNYVDRISRGNIGVVPNSKLLDGEIETRLKHYKQMIIADFINSYCFYAGGVE